MYVAICTKNISSTYLDIHVCKQEIDNINVCTCMYMAYTYLYESKHVYTSNHMYIHVWTMYIHVYTSKCMYMSIPCTYMFIDFQICMYMSIHFTKSIYMSEPCMYYSIVHTRHIHGSDMYIHVYAMVVGFQMKVWYWLWYHIWYDWTSGIVTSCTYRAHTGTYRYVPCYSMVPI